MPRYKQVNDVSKGEILIVPFTAQEEIEADHEEAKARARPAPRDPVKELDDLKAALMAKGVLKPEDLKGPA